jgi:uncharacterized protein (DUF433 family)
MTAMPTLIVNLTNVIMENITNLKNGDTIAAFLYDYPSVKKEQVIQLLALLERHYTYTEHEENIA